VQEHDTNKIKNDDKWDFSDYAYTITGILVGFLLVVPEILYSQFGISILGGSLGNVAPELIEGLDEGQNLRTWSINELRAISPLLFLLTTSIVFFQEAITARRTGGYKGSMFTHTFESLFEEAIYMTITTIMVYGAVLYGAMYASWLAGPITWILFIFIFPLVKVKSMKNGSAQAKNANASTRFVAPGETDSELIHEKKKSNNTGEERTPWLLLLIFVIGIIAEVVTGAWVAFPMSWLIICAIKLVSTIRKGNHTIDTVFDILYYAFSVILMAAGIFRGLWIASWTAFPLALLLCWIISKFGRFKKVEANE